MNKSILALGVLIMSSAVFADHSGEKDHSHHKQMVEKTIKVEVGKKGFRPQTPLHFKPNENIVLKVTRTTKKTCMTELKHPKTGKLIKLPMNKEVRFEIGSYKKPTEVKIVCGMDMKAGVIQVAEKFSKI